MTIGMCHHFEVCERSGCVLEAPGLARAFAADIFAESPAAARAQHRAVFPEDQIIGVKKPRSWSCGGGRWVA